MQLKENIYVRCPFDFEYPDFPRDFFYGKIVSINAIQNAAIVEFYDTNGIGQYYGDDLPVKLSVDLSKLEHVQIRDNAIVEFKKEKFVIKAGYYNNEDDFFYYYIKNDHSNVICVSEEEIIASSNDGLANPLSQIKNYEFQNPVWFFGHSNVSRKMQVIKNSLYGFKELAGCKIYLKPHQLKTVMRCLQYASCRYMIADEVGLGKTIEAASILKVYLLDKKNKNIAVIVPEALKEQWIVEMAFKFKLFIGENVNGNKIFIYSTDEVEKIKDASFDFVIVDEVHRFLNNDSVYSSLLSISIKAKNILMLSATPIQKREAEYQKLLTLIQPEKYKHIEPEHFLKLLSEQNNIIRRVYSAFESLDSLQEAIKDENESDDEEIEESIEELRDCLQKIYEQINDDNFREIVSSIDFKSDDHGIEKTTDALAYVCENYQLEKSIIRNRRATLGEDNQNIRGLADLSYELDNDFNESEKNCYNALNEWINGEGLLSKEDGIKYFELVQSFFSSASSFELELKKFSDAPNELVNYSKKWKRDENKLVDNIVDYLDEGVETCPNRLTSIIDFIDQKTSNSKVLLFTNYSATFNVYKKALIDYFGDECCAFFSKSMERDQLEINAYRFQNDKNCKILLSDESGGEGHNFQMADYVIHIDLPWKANDLEQRIGRLDRIGRTSDIAIISVVSYAKATTEEDLFKIWNEGLNVFHKSQSGLEIIMGDVDQTILDAIRKDFKYGLNFALPKIIDLISELTKIVKQERYFDIAAYQYSIINKLLTRSLNLFNKDETEMFSESMMSWASLAGFNGRRTDQGILFAPSTLSIRSFKKTLFMPPNMKRIIDDHMNQMMNRIKMLSDKKTTESYDSNYIEGTFERNVAIGNDYLHFFAPGDEIFDSITDNAIYSYRGLSSCFGVASKIRWMGFIFNWKIELDKALVYKEGLNENLLSQYIGFLPSNELIISIPIKESNLSEDEVIREFKRLLKTDSKKATHYGKRDSKNFEAIRTMFPEEKWSQMVADSFKESMESIKRKVDVLLKDSLADLKTVLMNEVSSQKAISDFYGSEDKTFNLEDTTRKIFNIISNPKISLDSVCMINMVVPKNEQ